jgi:Zn-dependent M32 family carboxypeptidase
MSPERSGPADHKPFDRLRSKLREVATLAHERFTDSEIGDLIAACGADEELTSDPAQAANLREMRRDWDRATKLPADLVAEMTATSSRALEAWKRARADDDFDTFRPVADPKPDPGAEIDPFDDVEAGKLDLPA